jgi:hypothetical protein
MVRPVTARYPRARALAAVLGVAVVLIALVMVTNRLRDDRPAAPVTEPITGAPLHPGESVDDYRDRIAPFFDPVPLGRPVTVTGNVGFAARLQAAGADDGATTAFVVQIQNIGREPFDGSFAKGGAWLESGEGERYYPPKVRVLATQGRSPAAIDPTAEAYLELTFTVPAGVRPAKLLLSLRLGGYYPYAQWTLPSR